LFLEEKNLADKLPDVVQKMENMLNEIQSKESTDYEKSNELDGEETLRIEKELRKLGYID
jgi:arsenate reductase-like glutaredoxin family protein